MASCETCVWWISSALAMGSAVLHTHILGLFPVRDLTVLGSRKVSARENVNTIVSFWNLTGSPTALLPRRLPNFRAIGKFYRNVIENTTPSYRWTSMTSCETCVWWMYLQCVSNGGCSHAYYILGLFPVRNLTVLGSRKVPSRKNVNTIASIWNLTGSSTALLPRRLPNFTAIGKFYGRSYDKTLELAAALLKKDWLPESLYMHASQSSTVEFRKLACNNQNSTDLILWKYRRGQRSQWNAHNEKYPGCFECCLLDIFTVQTYRNPHAVNDYIHKT